MQYQKWKKDLNLAIKILKDKFNINAIVLAGRTINRAFIFEYHGEKKELPYGNQQIEPLDIKKEEHGVVHLHYKFQKR